MSELIGSVDEPVVLTGSISPPLVIEVEIIGSGPAGADGIAATTYIHNQMLASNVWTINHNLDKFPSVTIVDTGGTVVLGDIQYVDSNTIRVDFTVEFSGKAYLN